MITCKITFKVKNTGNSLQPRMSSWSLCGNTTKHYPFNKRVSVFHGLGMYIRYVPVKLSTQDGKSLWITKAW